MWKYSDLTIYPVEIIPIRAKEKRFLCPECLWFPSSSPTQCLLCPDLGPEESIMKGFFFFFLLNHWPYHIHLSSLDKYNYSCFFLFFLRAPNYFVKAIEPACVLTKAGWVQLLLPASYWRHSTLTTKFTLRFPAGFHPATKQSSGGLREEGKQGSLAGSSLCD